MREVLEALEWVRREMMHRGSPDFIRQRELERRVHHMASRLARSQSMAPSPRAHLSDNARQQTKNNRHGKRFGPFRHRK